MRRITRLDRLADLAKSAILPPVAQRDCAGGATIADSLIRIIDHENEIAASSAGAAKTHIGPRACLQPSQDFRLARSNTDNIKVLPICSTASVKDSRCESYVTEAVDISENYIVEREQSALRIIIAGDITSSVDQFDAPGLRNGQPLKPARYRHEPVLDEWIREILEVDVTNGCSMNQVSENEQEGCSLHLFRRHPNRAVQADYFAVQHRVLNDVTGQLRVL